MRRTADSPHELRGLRYVYGKVALQRWLDRAKPDAGLRTSVEQHWTAVYRFLFRMTGHSQDTEDLARKRFSRRSSGWTPSPRHEPARLAAQIACNAFLDSRRKQARLKLAAAPPEVEDRSAAADQRLETAEQAALARAALDELTDLTRAVFICV